MARGTEGKKIGKLQEELPTKISASETHIAVAFLGETYILHQ
jgi:hypothetical protein